MNGSRWLWLCCALVLVPGSTFADNSTSQPNPIHPSFHLLDSKGTVIRTAGPELDQLRTCGQCHSTTFISKHSLAAHQQRRVACLTCHFENGKPDWSNTSFQSDGMLKREALKIFKSPNAACGNCHGLVLEPKTPVTVPGDFGKSSYPLPDTQPEQYQLTRATGTIYSAEPLSSSLLNLADKQQLQMPWDVHTKKLMLCTDCHYAPNNPQRFAYSSSTTALLNGEPRRETVRGYLQQPDHTLVKADCQTCHQAERGHKFLPYRSRHLEVVACESCHVPRLHGPAEKMVDATMLNDLGNPLVEYRGSDGGYSNLNTAYTEGYEPLLLALTPTQGSPASPRIAPYNLVCRWYWTANGNTDPIPLDTLRAALMVDGKYKLDVIAAFDANHDGRLDDRELRLDNDAKRELVTGLLVALGVQKPVIHADVQLERVSHGVSGRKEALSDCKACHSKDSRLNRGLVLASWIPGNVFPVWKNPSPAAGTISPVDTGGLVWASPPIETSSLHVLGLSGNDWPSRVGLLMLIAVVLAVGAHAFYRFFNRNRQQEHGESGSKVYLFTVYERIWHWVMALSVIALILTGLQIHFPGMFGLFAPVSVVGIHNFFAVVLSINAFLALFYHLATAAIRQFLPNRRGVADALTRQTKYYLRDIFRGLPAPFPRSPQRKLNVLQQFTYLLLLNVLFPFQVLTGIAIWSVGWSPAFARWIGGLQYLVPLHTLGSWMFISFLVAHVYLATTGRTVLAHLRGMIEGYEEVEEAIPSSGVRA